MILITFRYFQTPRVRLSVAGDSKRLRKRSSSKGSSHPKRWRRLSVGWRLGKGALELGRPGVVLGTSLPWVRSVRWFWCWGFTRFFMIFLFSIEGLVPILGQLVLHSFSKENKRFFH